MPTPLIGLSRDPGDRERADAGDRVARDGHRRDQRAVFLTDGVCWIENPAVQKAETITFSVFSLDCNRNDALQACLSGLKFIVILEEILNFHGGLEGTWLDSAGSYVPHAAVLARSVP